jgi:hypothetical protein
MARACFASAGVIENTRQLKHRRMLPRQQLRQQDDSAIREFQRVMMGGGDFSVDLAKTGNPAGGGSPP